MSNFHLTPVMNRNQATDETESHLASLQTFWMSLTSKEGDSAEGISDLAHQST